MTNPEKNGNRFPNDPRPAAKAAYPRRVEIRDPRVKRLAGNCFVASMEVLNPPEPIKHPRKPQTDQ